MLQFHLGVRRKKSQEVGRKGGTWLGKERGRRKGSRIRYGGRQERSLEGLDNKWKYAPEGVGMGAEPCLAAP